MTPRERLDYGDWRYGQLLNCWKKLLVKSVEQQDELTRKDAMVDYYKNLWIKEIERGENVIIKDTEVKSSVKS